MPYELFISLRYLNAKRKQVFISLISVISVGGVALGVTALIVVLAVMTGFKNDIRDKILGTMAHIVIRQHGSSIDDIQALLMQLDSFGHVRSIAPYVSGQVLISSVDNVTGIRVMGIDPHEKKAVEHLETRLLEGSVELLKRQFPNRDALGGPQRDGVILGLELAKTLGVFSGDEVTLLLPMGRILPTGPIPKLKKVRVVGILSSGFYEYDAGLAYISLTAAQRFFSMGTAVSGLEIRLNDVEETQAVSRELLRVLGPRYEVQNWAEMNQSLFSAINLEKLAMFLILALIVLVAAFNIISTLVMMVMDKHADIAILRSMGASRASIMKIFMYEGSVIGVAGTALGSVIALLFCWVADAKKLIPLDGGAYFLDHLPFSVTLPDVLLVILASLTICFLSTIYPARQASKLDPVVILRYE
ncbi:lipoprotein-releasing system transmembrane subunit LolC [candidate division KSB3 bacterium]|uniref:Lipoprotein-releasing system transmembrane subunit LolC n=1 Tax=candidate division KSB3 bacterium TaxID=2044937 RepID=A0A2G6E7U7_9BACT|nr:MAG: lipoprotein-releasing system transmembrane subunit LolC [candidate division KSB3 bacterium]